MFWHFWIPHSTWKHNLALRKPKYDYCLEQILYNNTSPLKTAKITDLNNSSFLLQDISYYYEAKALEENS